MPSAVRQSLLDAVVGAQKRLEPGDLAVHGPIHAWCTFRHDGVHLDARVVEPRHGDPPFLSLEPSGAVRASVVPLHTRTWIEQAEGSRAERSMHVALTAPSIELERHMWTSRRSWRLCRVGALMMVTLGLLAPWMASYLTLL